MRQQVGALPFRWIGDELRVLMVTSRETQRWIIPKGWRMRGRSDAEAAAQEAFEEAGVRGRIRRKPIGRYRYDKRRSDGVEECRITTYLLEVTDELDEYPEKGERRRAWFTLPEAATCADDEGLREILGELGPQLAALRDRKVARKRAKAGPAAGEAATTAAPDATVAGTASPPASTGKRARKSSRFAPDGSGTAKSGPTRLKRSSRKRSPAAAGDDEAPGDPSLPDTAEAAE